MNDPRSTKTEDELQRLREGGAKLSYILRTLREALEPGVRTDTLNEQAHALFHEVGGTPAFFQYQPSGAPRPFPGAACISVNEEVVHGIPNEAPRTLAEGDIVGIDAGLIYKDMVTDSAFTAGVGEVDPERMRLMRAAKEALYAGIDAARAGNTVSDIGKAVERVGARYDFGVVTKLGGHGVGHSVHESPFIPNFGGSSFRDTLTAGMVLAIEPMLNMGTEDVQLQSDGYTFITADGKPSAHFEHTVVVHEDAAEILTE